MYSAEVLSQLRSLNWLAEEIRRVPAGSLECVRLQEQISAVRARLPNSILGYHDQLAARGQPSAAAVSGPGCGACHGKLPTELLAELSGPRRFGVCPHCGVFLWSTGSGSARTGAKTGDPEVVVPTQTKSDFKHV